EIAEPDYGIITNVGKAHLEGFGGFDGVKQAKGELYAFLSANNGIAFLDGDNAHLEAMIVARGVKRIIRYGTKFDCECKGQLVESFPFLKVKWKYDLNSGTTSTK